MKKYGKFATAMGLAILCFGQVFAVTPCPPIKETNVLFEDFDGAPNAATWRVARRQWGGTGVNGGVRPETMHISDGSLKIIAQGDQYTGPILGINKQGIQQATGHRVGGCIVTENYFGSGSYEVRMKLAPDFGVCSTIWTFHYTETYPGPVIGNHEIDIETPGRPSSSLNNISHNYALCNTWVGEAGSQFTTGYTNVGKNIADGEFHTLRFDWHTQDPNPGSKNAKRVEFYIDDVLVRTNTTNIPTRAGRFWVGAWFPNNWAGNPNFVTSTMEVDWVRITPFNEAGDQVVCETYPDDGFGNLAKINIDGESPTPTASPAPTNSPTATPSLTATETPSLTATPVPTDSETPSPSVTPSVSATPVPTESETPSPSVTPSASATPMPTASLTASPTPSLTFSPSPTASFSPSVTASISPSPTSTPTASPTAAPTPTLSNLEAFITI